MAVLFGKSRSTINEHINNIFEEGELIPDSVVRDFRTTADFAKMVFKPTYITFNTNGTYSARGFFGDGSGTYKAKGKTITCFIDGTEYLKCDILSLSGTQCELKMYESGSSSSIKIRWEKQ